MLTALVVLILLFFGSLFVKRFSNPAGVSKSTDNAWERAVATENSQVGKILLRASRPLSNMPQIYDSPKNPQYKALHAKVMSSGTYGGNLEVFLAVQAMAAFIGLIVLVATAMGGSSKSLLFVGIALGLGIAALPWNLVSKKAKDREKAVAEGLPDFAELLLMPLESGMTPMAALSFTADRLDGPVAMEVKNLRTIINSRSMPEPEAFQLAATRLGTAEANAFFTALMQAHLEGAKVMRNLQAQAEGLRVAAHQKKRSEMKLLPVKLVLIFALHLLPVLFVAALLPTFFSLASI